jgi:transcriptional regulator with XRE-family HTH domain
MNDEKERQLGEYIRYIRKAHGVTIRGLAVQAGIDSGGLARLENGKIPNPRPDTLSALARVLNIPFADLFARAGYTAPRELPSVEPYLRIRYDCLSSKETQAITTIVEALARLHEPA